MIATAVTLALIYGLGFAAYRTYLSDGSKIAAALRGNSYLANPPQSFRPVTVRIKQRYSAPAPQRARAALRAAA